MDAEGRTGDQRARTTSIAQEAAGRWWIPCVAIVVLTAASGCAVTEGRTSPDALPIQLQGVEMDIGGTVGPRHGPYPMGR
jgi:hypothetical protein